MSQKKSSKGPQEKQEQRTKKEEQLKLKIKEEEIFREINVQSFGENFEILIHHYKKQIEKNPPRIKAP